MIVGVGIDVVDIARFAETLARTPALRERLFTTDERGLGIFEGTVKRFPADARVPHMGWNSLERRRDARLLAGLPEQPYVYYAHSYYVPDADVAAAVTTYTTPYTALLEHKNVFGVQFHPEKSGPVGLKIVKNFLELESC